MTSRRPLLVKFCFVCLLFISFLLFLYSSNLLPFFKADWNEQKIQPKEDIAIPSVEELDRLSHGELAQFYHRYINTPQALCSRIVRIGKLGDGGWEVCEDKLYKPKPPCSVFSFGIADDFSFDDHMAERYGCEVHSFDPSMTLKEGPRGEKTWFHNIGLAGRTEKLNTGWLMETFDDILKKLDYRKRTIDVLKVDIEESEWQALPQMIESGVLHKTENICCDPSSGSTEGSQHM